MFGNVALDIVIGLVFIYLLYSLLATVLSEIIATAIQLRAKNLKEALYGMLNGKAENKNFFNKLFNSVGALAGADRNQLETFYQAPEIQQLERKGLFKLPSNLKAASFSRMMIYLLSDNGAEDREKIESELRRMANGKSGILSKDMATYVLSIWQECYGDIIKFRLHLEAWFDRSMEQATEWYKRKIQIILLLIGFFIAWFFNADTFSIVGRLSTDKKAREEMVRLASAYVENLPDTLPVAASAGSSAHQDIEAYNRKVDSLLAVKKQLDTDIASANAVLGLGAWLPDTVWKTNDAAGRISYRPLVDVDVFERVFGKPAPGKIGVSCGKKWCYFFLLAWFNFFGFLITALAVSLGAPFWFDLLNKIMRLRTSTKEETAHTTDPRDGGGISRLKTVG